jgi:hypothetical protein
MVYHRLVLARDLVLECMFVCKNSYLYGQNIVHRAAMRRHPTVNFINWSYHFPTINPVREFGHATGSM